MAPLYRTSTTFMPAQGAGMQNFASNAAEYIIGKCLMMLFDDWGIRRHPLGSALADETTEEGRG